MRSAACVLLLALRISNSELSSSERVLNVLQYIATVTAVYGRPTCRLSRRAWCLAAETEERGVGTGNAQNFSSGSAALNFLLKSELSFVGALSSDGHGCVRPGPWPSRTASSAPCCSNPRAT